jgi:hypothetical protein
MMLLGACGSVSRAARADGASFVWSAPSCGGSQAGFEKRLAELTSKGDRPRLAGTVIVTPEGDDLGLEVRLELDGKYLGARRFSVPSCERAVETAAVAASLAVFDGGEAPAAASASGISPDMWSRHPEPLPDNPPPRAKPLPAPSPYRLRLGALGFAELGTLPEPSAGGGAALGLDLGSRWSLQVGGQVSLEQGRSLGGAQQVRLRAFDVAGKGCWAALLRAAFRLEGCAGFRVTTAFGSGQDLEVNRSASLAWFAPLLGAAGSLAGPGPFVWRFELEASTPLARRRFLVDEREVMRPKSVVLTARVGPFVRF